MRRPPPGAEAARRLQAAGVKYTTELALPPRSRQEDFVGRDVRQYVVRQRTLPDDTLSLTLIYRITGKEVQRDGFEN